MSAPPPDLATRLAAVRLVVLDVDGVLTDGTLVYGPDGEETKAFFVRDGRGIKKLRAAGVEVAIVTGRGNDAVVRRMEELGVARVACQVDDKWAVVAELLAELDLDVDALCCAGDDDKDVPVMQRAALAVAPADAHENARAAAHWITDAPGGRGSVRELADAICAARAAAGAVAEPRIAAGTEPTAAVDFRVVIPARYASTRLPGKPLRLLAGKPMIAHVVERAHEAGAREVVVATDDSRIADAVADTGARAVMTSPECASGTDRLAEVARAEGWGDADIVVNLQGDEPLMRGDLVRRVAAALVEHPTAGIATLATPVRDAADLFDPAVVKVVLSDAGCASYFSRAPIPWPRDALAAAGGAPLSELPEGVPYLRHLGLYAYRVGVLGRLAAAAPSPAERAESLEQLRALAMGIDIHVTIEEDVPGHGVDTEADLARVERELAATPRNT